MNEESRQIVIQNCNENGYEFECKDCSFHGGLDQMKSVNVPPGWVCPECGGHIENVTEVDDIPPEEEAIIRKRIEYLECRIRWTICSEILKDKMYWDIHSGCWTSHLSYSTMFKEKSHAKAVKKCFKHKSHIKLVKIKDFEKAMKQQEENDE